MTDMIKYLIIGNSAGAIGAVEAIREVDKLGTLTIVSEEPYPAYSRPLISEYLVTGCSLERMLFRSADFYEQHNVQTVLDTKVTEIDTDDHSVLLADGSKFAYEKLLLATGGVPIFPKMEGSELQGVFSFTTLNDAKAIDEYLKRQHKAKIHAVVIGGGLIGVSVTEALVKRDVDVTIVEMKDRVLNTILDQEASNLETVELKKAGVEIITDHTVAKIISYIPDIVTGVTLDDGQNIQCDIVVVAIGVRPRIELATGAGIEVNRGIVVNRNMATTLPDVYACGDAVEAYDFVYNTNRLSPIWPNAYMGGRIAGLNMAGLSTDYQGGTTMNSMRYFGLNVVSAGMVISPDDSYEVISSIQDKTYRKVILKNGLIQGMVLTNEIEKAGIIYNLMKDKVNVEDFKETLVDGEFSLISLPESLWREKVPALSTDGQRLVAEAELQEEVAISR